MGPKMKGLKRFENIVRGSMVGTIATAMRNFEGFIIRAPMEGLTNLFTNAIVAGAKGGVRGEEGLLNYMKESPSRTPSVHTERCSVTVRALRNTQITFWIGKSLHLL